MPRIVNLYKANSQLSSLVEEAAERREVIVTKAGMPRARLVLPRSPHGAPGGSMDRICVAADFDVPLPADVLDGFIGRKR